MHKPSKYHFLKKFLFLCLGFLFISLTFFVFYQGLSGPFLLDDLSNIVPTKLTHLSWNALLNISTQSETGLLGRPLSQASFALNHYFVGSSPFHFKIVNLFLHCLLGVCLFFLTHKIIKSLKTEDFHASYFSNSTTIWASMAITFLWLLHPLQVSTVLYSVQRMTILSSLFIILGLLGYLQGRQWQLSGKKFGLIFGLFSLLFCGLFSFLCKENGVLLPLYALCLEVFVLRFKTPNLQQKKRLLTFHTLVVLAFLVGGSFFYLQHYDAYLLRFAEKGFTLGERILTECRALIFYVKMILLPNLSDMSLYHDDFALSHSSLTAYLCAAILIATSLLAFLWRKKHPLVAFGLFWFLTSHVIESTILPLELVFEPHNYLALWGLMFIPIYALSLLQKAIPQHKTTLPVLGVIFLGAITFLTFQRATTWGNHEAFLRVTKANHPNSPRAHIEWANFLLQQHKNEEALAALSMAQTLQPNHSGIALHKVLIHCNLPTLPHAIFQETEGKTQNGIIVPYSLSALEALVKNVLVNQCDAVSPTNTISLLNAALQNPNVQHKPHYLSILYHLKALVHVHQGEMNLATQALSTAYDFNKKNITLLIQKASIELNAQNFAQANKTVLKLIEITKNHWIDYSEQIAPLIELLERHEQDVQTL